MWIYVTGGDLYGSSGSLHQLPQIQAGRLSQHDKGLVSAREGSSAQELVLSWQPVCTALGWGIAKLFTQRFQLGVLLQDQHTSGSNSCEHRFSHHCYAQLGTVTARLSMTFLFPGGDSMALTT